MAKESYTLDEVIELLAEAQDAGIDIDSLPDEMTLHELHAMVDAL